ncbi:hypothetical protein BJ878DRAFT_576152 [Calycina marina]|uniref:2,6-dihydroxypyridine 3-monooxygenase substrate binding domain-containing protein n=1 Tax=Calycina marina TaxID=1763456 RepID=A0A9P7Z2X9_9HELO|nr:hypothetical protein BJ878DRAFT_576152 [Calycina marina]
MPLNIITVGGFLAGIVAGGEIPAFMEQYDRIKIPLAVASKQRLYLNKKGKITGREDKQQYMTSWDRVYYICRANLDCVQSKYTSDAAVKDLTGEGSSVYQHGVAVMGIEEGPQKFRLVYKSTLFGEENDGEKSMEADFVIVAEGSSSNIRKESCGEDILGYTIPDQGVVTPGERMIKWVWYINIKGDSDEYQHIMTDTCGATYRLTLPAGGHMLPGVWEARKKDAVATLPPQFTELVAKTQTNFVQAITDLEPLTYKKCWLLGEKAVLAGDALAVSGHILLRLRRKLLCILRDLAEQGVFLGNRSQFGNHLLAD